MSHDETRLDVLASPVQQRHRRWLDADLLATLCLWLIALLVFGVFVWILFDIFSRGLSQINGAYFVDSPEDAGRSGGIGPVIVSTLLILGVTLAAAVPISLASAIALVETFDRHSPLVRMVRQSLDVLASVPSIVFGLFGNAFFCVVLGLGYSILAGGLTLACMILPILVRTMEVALSGVPNEYRQAAAALGLSRVSILWRVVLPVAAPGMAAGLILGIGRALAETAALIFTSGYVTRWPTSPLDSGRALSVHIFDLAMNVPGASSRAYGAACVLIALLLIINGAASVMMRLAGFRTAPQVGQGG